MLVSILVLLLEYKVEERRDLVARFLLFLWVLVVCLRFWLAEKRWLEAEAEAEVEVEERRRRRSRMSCSHIQWRTSYQTSPIASPALLRGVSSPHPSVSSKKKNLILLFSSLSCSSMCRRKKNCFFNLRTLFCFLFCSLSFFSPFQCFRCCECKIVGLNGCFLSSA